MEQDHEETQNDHEDMEDYCTTQKQTDTKWLKKSIFHVGTRSPLFINPSMTHDASPVFLPEHLQSRSGLLRLT